jgi:zinc transport system substrate-binding protein
MLRRFSTWMLLCLMLPLLIACGGQATTTDTQSATAPTNGATSANDTLSIVASTSWVGAFAKLAGATTITVIAPSNLQHPPDYDPKPSDLQAIGDADYVLLAGFEGFAARMQDAVGGDSNKVITVATENSLEAIRKEVTRLADIFGTQDVAAQNLATFESAYTALSNDVKATLNGKSAVVVNQLFVTPWVFFAGYTPAGMYGPMPMTAEELKKLTDLKPNVIFENAHMPAGQALAEATGATVVSIVNFPDERLDLLTVAEANANAITTALAGTTNQVTTANRTQYPVTIRDCGGRETTYDKAPERIVTLDPAITESLLLLGLKDKIVGFTEFQTPDQRWAITKSDMDALPVINKDMAYPSKEAILAASPDIVMSVYPSALLENSELPNRDGWNALGINAYLTLGECHESTTPVTEFSLLYTDIRNLGIIFDVQARAEEEIAKLEQRVTAIQQKVADAKLPERTMWSYSGEEEPYPAGAIGTPNAIMTMAGVTNAFGDIARDYDAVSWEEIVKRNPDIIWIMTSAGEGFFITEAEGIQAKLESDSRSNTIRAVQNKAYVILSYNEGGVETPRNVDALERMVDALLALK